MILDEVQTGFCRTGRMFACEHYGVTPDVLCLAKAVGGGLPLGAVLANGKVPPATSLHGTTSAGSPLACSAALAAIRFMEEHDLAGRARSLGAFFRERFSDPLPRRVRSVRQIGLMIGIERRARCRRDVLAERPGSVRRARPRRRAAADRPAVGSRAAVVVASAVVVAPLPCTDMAPRLPALPRYAARARSFTMRG